MNYRNPTAIQKALAIHATISTIERPTKVGFHPGRWYAQNNSQNSPVIGSVRFGRAVVHFQTKAASGPMSLASPDEVRLPESRHLLR